MMDWFNGVLLRVLVVGFGGSCIWGSYLWSLKFESDSSWGFRTYVSSLDGVERLAFMEMMTLPWLLGFAARVAAYLLYVVGVLLFVIGGLTIF